MKKSALMVLAATIGVFLAYAICWALMAFISWEPNIGKWHGAERFILVLFGTPFALLAGAVFASAAEASHG